MVLTGKPCSYSEIGACQIFTLNPADEFPRDRPSLGSDLPVLWRPQTGNHVCAAAYPKRDNPTRILKLGGNTPPL
jgi:hypothetical protein